MSPITNKTSIRSSWHRASSTLALVAALSFALQSPFTMAQTPPEGGVPAPSLDIPALPPPAAVDTPAPDTAQPKPKPKKVAHKRSPTDNLSDDLNRRETAKAEQLADELRAQSNGSATATAAPTSSPVAAPVTAPATSPMSAPVASPLFAAPLATPPSQPAPSQAVAPSAAAGAVVAAPPAPASTPAPPPAPATVAPVSVVASTPPAAEQRPGDGGPTPIVTASLTPTGTTQQTPATPAPTSPSTPAVPLPPGTVPTTPAPPLQQVQTPVPIQPPAAGPPSPIIGAPSRPFAQSQVVPTQQPTLNLEINKGTALRLPGPAATVFVAAPDIADVQVKSPGMIYVFAKKAGDTVLYAVDAQDRVLLNTIVHVTSPISRMKASLDALHPGNGVNFDNQADTVVLSGTVRSAAIAEDARRLAMAHVNNAAAKVIDHIRINAPNQVQLRVKIAEVDRDSLKRVGINWMNIQNLVLFGVVPTVSAGFAVSTIQSTGGAGSGAAAIQTTGGLNGLIDLLATQNKATILAEPNLIAMSGETASFLAGGEIPIIAPQAGLTGSTISVTYKDIGVQLAFTPTIIGERINLKVAPEVSQVTSNGSIQVPLTATSVVTIPALQTRRASTTVELGSGQSFAIAGLMQQTSEQDVTKIPWLGDVPILGTLFKSEAYQRAETELVIVVTPYLVEPTNEQMRTPLSGMVPPTDVDRLLLQRLNHPTPPNNNPVGYGPQAAIPAAAGFKLD